MLYGVREMNRWDMAHRRACTCSRTGSCCAGIRRHLLRACPAQQGLQGEGGHGVRLCRCAGRCGSCLVGTCNGVLRQQQGRELACRTFCRARRQTGAHAKGKITHAQQWRLCLRKCHWILLRTPVPANPLSSMLFEVGSGCF